MTIALHDYLPHIGRAAFDARVFVQGMDKATFLTDRRTQQAVVMSLVIIGEVATRIMDQHAAFAAAHPDIHGKA